MGPISIIIRAALMLSMSYAKRRGFIQGFKVRKPFKKNNVGHFEM